jgi:hypothetical protein
MGWIVAGVASVAVGWALWMVISVDMMDQGRSERDLRFRGPREDDFRLGGMGGGVW